MAAQRKDQAKSPVPAHLQELLQPTASGTAKLIAAWDGLMPETQITLLVARKKLAGNFDYFYHRVLNKALKADNAFVRYMAAQEMRFLDREEREKAGIDNDPELWSGMLTCRQSGVVPIWKMLKRSSLFRTRPVWPGSGGFKAVEKRLQVLFLMPSSII